MAALDLSGMMARLIMVCVISAISAYPNMVHMQPKDEDDVDMLDMVNTTGPSLSDTPRGAGTEQNRPQPKRGVGKSDSRSTRRDVALIRILIFFLFFFF